MNTVDLGIIGAGAAGVFCAINTALLAPQAKIAIFEATHSPLAKVRISGGGRCNVTHHCFEPATLVKNYPRGAQELRGAFSKFQPQDTVAWFAARGVTLKTEADGRMFPVSDSSQTVIDCLMSEADRLGVKLVKGQKILKVGRNASGHFEITSRIDEVTECRFLLLATGSSPEGHQLAVLLGHKITALAPSLFTFKVTDERIKGFLGVSFPEASLQLTIAGSGKKHEFFGALLITHWGFSGPAVLKLSAFAAHDLFQSGYQAELRINFVGSTVAEAEKCIQNYAVEHPKQLIVIHSMFSAIPLRWWAHLCKVVGIGPEQRFAEIKATLRAALAKELTAATYQVSGKGIFKEEFVTAGGVALTEVDFRTMESKRAPGLYFSGEVLDVDGITGGFNFQNAWTTAMLAARALGARLS